MKQQQIEYVYELLQAKKALKAAEGHGREQQFQKAYEASLALAAHARLMAQAYRSWIKEEQ